MSRFFKVMVPRSKRPHGRTLIADDQTGATVWVRNQTATILLSLSSGRTHWRALLGRVYSLKGMSERYVAAKRVNLGKSMSRAREDLLPLGITIASARDRMGEWSYWIEC